MPRVIDEFGRVYNIPAHVLSGATAGTSRGQTPPKIELHIHIHVHVEGAEVALGGVTRELAMDCGAMDCGALECGDMDAVGKAGRRKKRPGRRR